MAIQPVIFKLKGADRGVPAAFSDEVIEGLGKRLMDGYNACNVDALFRDYDESVVGRFTRMSIDRKLGTGLNQFGPIAEAGYAGFLGAKLKKGVQWYDLMYELRFERSPGQVGSLIATVSDRAAGVRLLDFSIDDHPVLMQAEAGEEVVSH
jgi:hypothetical protein